MTNEELLAARDVAWEEWNDYEYRTYQPRFYKKGKGQINGWTSLAEILAAMKERQRLAARYYYLNNQCYDRGLPRHLPNFVWYEEQTPDGKRFRRRNER